MIKIIQEIESHSVHIDIRFASKKCLSKYFVMQNISIYDRQSFSGKNGKINRDRKSTRLNSSHMSESRMPSSA